MTLSRCFGARKAARCVWLYERVPTRVCAFACWAAIWGNPQTALTDVKSADLPSKPTQTRATELGEKEPEGSQAKHAAALSGFGRGGGGTATHSQRPVPAVVEFAACAIYSESYVIFCRWLQDQTRFAGVGLLQLR